MKVKMEIDCSPEEARRFLGLPDMTPVHETMMDHMKEAADNAAGFISPEKMVQEWLPLTGKAMEQFQQAFWSAAGAGSAHKKDEDS